MCVTARSRVSDEGIPQSALGSQDGLEGCPVISTRHDLGDGAWYRQGTVL